MIHGIHAGRDRVNPFRDARDSTSRGVITLLDFARMDFPGRLNNCETCHIAGTYSGVPTNALPSTYETVDAAYDAAIAGGTATTALARGALSTTTANGTDRVTTPYTGARASCHASEQEPRTITRWCGARACVRPLSRIVRQCREESVPVHACPLSERPGDPLQQALRLLPWPAGLAGRLCALLSRLSPTKQRRIQQVIDS